MDSIEEQAPVMLTTNSRKVYVGYVFEAPNLRTDVSYVKILPAMSGSRDPENLTVKLTTGYMPLWDSGVTEPGPGPAPEHLAKAIPVNTIAAASLFDVDVYGEHFQPEAIASPT